jgi:uncharacterized membrane protein YidH (DUF202 family)
MNDPTAPPPEPADDPDVPGLSGERTDLAWSRSALSASVAGAVILRRVWEHVDSDNAKIIVFTLIGVGGAVWLTALTWAHSTARTTIEGRTVADQRALRRVTVGTILFCLAALLLALVPAE